jgi:hypothetical protein
MPGINEEKVAPNEELALPPELEHDGESYFISEQEYTELRFNPMVNSELTQFILSTEESGSYFYRGQSQYWYEFCLLPDNPEDIHPGKIYLSRSINNTIVYTMQGVMLDSKIPAPNPFRMDKLLEHKSQLLKIAAKARHIPATFEYEAGVPCTSEFKETPDKIAMANNPHLGIKFQRVIIREGELGLIWNGPKAQFLASGVHLLPIEPGLELERTVRINNKFISHGGKQRIVVSPGQFVGVEDPLLGGQVKLLTEGVHYIDSPTAKFFELSPSNELELRIVRELRENTNLPERPVERPVLHEDKAEAKSQPVPREKKEGRIIFIRVPKGKFAVLYDSLGNLCVFRKPGNYYIPATWGSFVKRLSSKIDVKEFDLTSVYTGDDIPVNVNAVVQFQIENAFHSILQHGPNKIEDIIRDLTKQAVIQEINKTFLYFDKNSGNYLSARQGNEVEIEEAQGPIIDHLNRLLASCKIRIVNVFYTLKIADPRIEARINQSKEGLIDLEGQLRVERLRNELKREKRRNLRDAILETLQLAGLCQSGLSQLAVLAEDKHEAVLPQSPRASQNRNATFRQVPAQPAVALHLPSQGQQEEADGPGM